MKNLHPVKSACRRTPPFQGWPSAVSGKRHQESANEHQQDKVRVEMRDKWAQKLINSGRKSKEVRSK